MAQWKQTHASRLIAAVSECSDYAHIQQTYTNLRECIGAHFFHDDSEIITTYDKPTQSRTPREGAFSGELMETAIRSGNFEEADRILNLLYNDLDDMSYSIKQIRAYATEAFLSLIRRTCPQNLPDFFDDAFRIMNGDSLNRIIQIFRESIHRVMEKGDARRDISKNPMVKRVEEIVEQEIGNEELSLNYIAKKYLFISSTYMGKLFTAEKGERFSHYVTEKRMKFAKELLVTQPHMRIQDVSVKVGYGYATQYFSRVFKQKTGYTPSEYREKFCFDSIENTEEKREEK